MASGCWASIAIVKKAAKYPGKIAELDVDGTSRTNEDDKSDKEEKENECSAAESKNSAEASDWRLTVASIAPDWFTVSFLNFLV